MKKIKIIFLNSIIVIFVAAFFAFAAEVKNTSATQALPVKATPTVTPAQIKPPPVSPGGNGTSTAILKRVEQPQPSPVPADISYSYNPLGKPDPFRPFIVVEKVEKKNEKDKVEKKEPLSIFPMQRAETDSYRVVGIAGKEDHRVAIAEDPAKKFYPLVKGTRIGLHNGKVVEIMADRVIVEEYDNKKAKRVILKLRRN
jgi:type IV pilus assembly protein PilP